MSDESPRGIEIGSTNVGLGLICTRRHEAGEALLSERPLLSVPGDYIPEGWVAMNATWRLVEALIRDPAKLIALRRWNLRPCPPPAVDRLLAMDEVALHKRYRFPRDALRKLFASVAVYNIGHRDPVAGEHYALYHLLCFANHACAPSAKLVQAMSNGLSASLVALQPLEAGDEVTWCYEDEGVRLLQASVQQRRHWLHERYGFTCACARCEQEADQNP
jgi:hypothetical protein